MTSGSQDRSSRQAKIDAAAPKPSKLKPVLVAVVSIVAVVAIVGGVWLSARGDGDGDAGGQSQASAPQGATGPSGGIVVHGDKVKQGAPTLDIYEDFQCPACKSAEEQLGATIEQMAAAGDVKVVYHMKSFLDANIGNDASFRSAVAASCAADAGRFDEYHKTIYANQPQEGAGYSDAQLKAFAEKSGITGDAMTTWEKCYSDQQYGDYVKAVEEQTARDGVTATPAFHVNGKEFDLRQVTSPQDFRQKVLAAGQQGQ